MLPLADLLRTSPRAAGALSAYALSTLQKGAQSTVSSNATDAADRERAVHDEDFAALLEHGRQQADRK